MNLLLNSLQNPKTNYISSLIFCLTSSNPCPSLTEIRRCSFQNFFWSSTNLAGEIRSILLKTKILFWRAPILSKISFTTSILSWINVSEESMTCNRKSASILSSKVEENDLISLGGNSRINPIVSLSKTSFPLQVSGSMIKRFPTCVPRVAKSLFSARTHFFVRAFNRDDFPELVYPTIPTVGIPFLFLPSL